MSEVVISINKVSVTVPDESGDYTVSAWVVGEDNPTQEVFIEDPQSTTGGGPADPLNQALGNNGFASV